jgi:hypothetical protein
MYEYCKIYASIEAGAASTSGFQAVKMALTEINQACGGRGLPTARAIRKKSMEIFKIRPRGLRLEVILTCLSSIGPKPGFLKAG